MSRWDKVTEFVDIQSEFRLINGDMWIVSYSFEIPANTTYYLIFEFGEDEEIHPTYRTIRASDLSNNIINLEMSTIINPPSYTLGTMIDKNIINSNFNKENSFNFHMYDETSSITDEGNRIVYESSLQADRKSSSISFIENEYIAPLGGIVALKFDNVGGGDIRLEYISGGHRRKL